jgi:hypothetical protein
MGKMKRYNQMTYIISSTELRNSDSESEEFQSVEDARHWVINHLDLSADIEIIEIGSTRHNELKMYGLV